MWLNLLSLCHVVEAITIYWCAENISMFYGQMGQGEDDDGGSTSSSEDEIISMCRKNLKMAQNFVAQMVPIFGMYSDNYFVKLPRRRDGESGLQWV